MQHSRSRFRRRGKLVSAKAVGFVNQLNWTRGDAPENDRPNANEERLKPSENSRQPIGDDPDPKAKIWPALRLFANRMSFTG